MISEPFIRRPVGTSLLAFALLLAGGAAYFSLPVAPLPRVDMPTIQVNATLPGANPETMASAVATPLERRFGRIAGLSELTSISAMGSASITLQFDLERDVDAAARDVQAAINAAGGELPTNLPTRPTYRKANPADAPILILSLNSETMPLGQIYDAANSILAQKISQVRGVGQVTVGGGQQPAVRVQADPAVLAGLGLTLDDIRSTLNLANVNQPKGALQGTHQMETLAVNDQLVHAVEYEQLIVTYKNNAAVRLKDVARVFDDVENARAAGWTNGKRGIVMIVRRQPDANIIDTIERVKGVLPQLAASISPAIHIDIAMDRSQTIRASVRDVGTTLALSVVLVILVVFAFLRSVRATAIPAVAVPLSLVGTFAVMYVLGYSLDNLSLMALTISTGFVVDDAIVVTENITRYIEEGKTPLEASLLGARQIAFTIVSITLSLLAVFIPILLMGGVVGRLFREFAGTLSVAVAISAIISLTLTPMLCAHFLRHESQQQNALQRAFERAFDALVAGYGHGLRWALAHRLTVLALTLLTVAVNVGLFFVVPMGLFPQQDVGLIMGFTEAGQDVSFLVMRDAQQKVDAIIRADPDVAHAVSWIGAGGTQSGNTGTVFIDLKPKPGRTATADEIINRLRPKLSGLTTIRTFLQAAQDVRVGGRSSRTQYQYSLQDANLEELRVWAPRVVERFRKLKHLKDVNTDQQTSGLQANVNLDRDTAGRLGIYPKNVDDELYDAFGQRQVSTIFTQLNQYRVVLEMLPELQLGPAALERLWIKPNYGSSTAVIQNVANPNATGPVPLNAIASFSTSATPLSISHQGQFPAITLSFNLAPGVSLGDAVTAIRAAETEMRLPPSVHAAFQGTAQAFKASLASQPLLIMAALITVYIVLGVLYESFIHPITILSTLPSAGIGALLALLVCGSEFSVIALIGIILLIGIVKKNAIMMIDFAIEAERDHGLPPAEAIYKACILRFRPILMTTAAALLGGLPLAFGEGTGAELRKPLGITIVGGLMISQILTLYTTPIVYLALDRFTRRKKRVVG